MSCRVISWIKGIFEIKKPRKRVVLTPYDVERFEEMILSYDRETIINYFGVSEGTYYNIKRGVHRYSSE